MRPVINLRALIEFKKPNSVTKIAKKLRVHHTNIWRMKERMLKLGFIEFIEIRNSGRRGNKFKMYQITEKGKQYLELLKPLIGETG